MSSLRLSLRSMWNRSLASALTIFSIALSVTLLLSIDRIRDGVKSSFEQTLSGMDLVVGPRGGSLQVLLYSVFHIGSPNNNIRWQSYEAIRSHPEVAWTIPMSVGDSHRSFPVVGTDESFFKFFKAAGHTVSFSAGQAFAQKFEAVLGYDVAQELHYTLGQKLVLSHGMGEASFHDHEDKPFHVVGILNKTGTPADRTVHISLVDLDAIHEEWHEAVPSNQHEEHEHEEHEHEHHATEHVHAEDSPRFISAFLVGLKSKLGVLSFQRMVNEYAQEPLMAIVPGLTFTELWSLISTADAALFVISIFVIFAGIIGMLASLLTTLEGRRREISILRALGASPFHIFRLFLSEAIFLALGAYLLGYALMYPLLHLLGPVLAHRYGFNISLHFNFCINR